MFPAGKAQDARDFDKLAMDNGVLSLILMENAAFSLYLEVSKLIEEFAPKSIVAFAGKGGNGGDGLALLRILRDRGCDIPMKVVPFFKPEELSGDTLVNWKILPENIEVVKDLNIEERTLVIDAMIGIGLKNDLRGKVLETVRYINGLKDVKIVAVDIPTGLNSDTGEINGETIMADLTVTFGIFKTGLFASKGPSVCGRLVLGKISGIYGHENYRYKVIDETELEPVKVAVDSYKNSNGHLLIIGGDVEKLGATIISAKSFLFSGGGLVTGAFDRKHHDQLAGKMPSMMLTDTKKAVTELDKYDSVVIGPGLMAWPFDRDDVFKDYRGTLIVDAGMFDIIEDERIQDSLKNCNVVFTPHPGELKRFLDKTEPWIDLVDRFPLKKGHVLVAKSHSTFIRTNEDVKIVPTGAKALSFGGTGDALTGILAFEITKNGMEKGVQRGVLRHRLAGIMLEKRFGASCHDIDKLLELIGESGK